MIVIDQGVKLKSYDVQNMSQNESNLAFSLTKGCHFDHENHNFLLINEYISLSFSFMTLVIRDKHQSIKAHEVYHYNLDEEQFKFNINKKTFLTCDNFVTFDYDKLENSLKFILKRDKELLEQLNYYYVEKEKVQANKVKYTRMSTFDSLRLTENLRLSMLEDSSQEIDEKIVTPLHLALSNNRSVNILLEYMSYVDYNASGNFKDIMDQLVDKTKFA